MSAGRLSIEDRQPKMTTLPHPPPPCKRTVCYFYHRPGRSVTSAPERYSHISLHDGEHPRWCRRLCTLTSQTVPHQVPYIHYFPLELLLSGYTYHVRSGIYHFVNTCRRPLAPQHSYLLTFKILIQSQCYTHASVSPTYHRLATSRRPSHGVTSQSTQNHLAYSVSPYRYTP